MGERLKHRICNTSPCPHDEPSFRNIQCSHFNSLPYKDKFYRWEAVINKGQFLQPFRAPVHILSVWYCCSFLLCLWTVNPCELHCRPLNEQFSEKMRDTVVDGTPCYSDKSSRDVCINGICQVVMLLKTCPPIGIIVFFNLSASFIAFLLFLFIIFLL